MPFYGLRIRGAKLKVEANEQITRIKTEINSWKLICVGESNVKRACIVSQLRCKVSASIEVMMRFIVKLGHSVWESYGCKSG